MILFVVNSIGKGGGLKLFIFMIKTLLKRNFSSAIDVLSTKNLKKFGCNDYP